MEHQENELSSMSLLTQPFGDAMEAGRGFSFLLSLLPCRKMLLSRDGTHVLLTFCEPLGCALTPETDSLGWPRSLGGKGTQKGQLSCPHPHVKWLQALGAAAISSSHLLSHPSVQPFHASDKPRTLINGWGKIIFCKDVSGASANGAESH